MGKEAVIASILLALLTTSFFGGYHLGKSSAESVYNDTLEENTNLRTSLGACQDGSEACRLKAIEDLKAAEQRYQDLLEDYRQTNKTLNGRIEDLETALGTCMTDKQNLQNDKNDLETQLRECQAGKAQALAEDRKEEIMSGGLFFILTILSLILAKITFGSLFDITIEADVSKKAKKTVDIILILTALAILAISIHTIFGLLFG